MDNSGKEELKLKNDYIKKHTTSNIENLFNDESDSNNHIPVFNQELSNFVQLSPKIQNKLN